MAMLWLESFDAAFGTSPGAPTQLASKYTVSGSTTNTALVTGRVGGLGLKIHNATGSGAYISPPSNGNQQDWVVGFGLQTGILIDSRIFSMYDGGSEQFALRMTASGALAVYRGTSAITLGESAAAVLTASSWHYVEVKVRVGNAGVGFYEVRVNGVNVVSDANEDTQASANAYANTIRFWGVFDSSSTFQFAFDDLYIFDMSGADNNDFLGSQKIDCIRSNGAGDSTQLTPNTGSNYQAVDDTGHDGDSTYVESGTVGHQDLYAFASTTLSDIKGMQINAVCKETDMTPFDVKLVCKSGSTVDEGSSQPIGSTTYLTRHRILEEDPDTTAQWDAAGVSAAQFGIEVD